MSETLEQPKGFHYKNLSVDFLNVTKAADIFDTGIGEILIGGGQFTFEG